MDPSYIIIRHHGRVDVVEEGRFLPMRFQTMNTVNTVGARGR